MGTILVCGTLLLLLHSSLDADAPVALDSNRGYSRALASKEHWACDRPWPELELFLPINTKLGQTAARLSEWKDIYLRTMLLFWPLQISKTSLLLLMDSENRDNEVDSSINTFVNHTLVQKIPGGVRIAYNDPSKYYLGHGHDGDAVQCV